MAHGMWPKVRGKVLYFVLFVKMASEYRFLPLFFAKYGCSHAEIGVLMAFKPFSTLVSTPVWTAFADARRAHRHVLLLIIVLCMVCFPTLLVSPLLRPSATTHFPAFVATRLAMSAVSSAAMPLTDTLALRALGPNKHLFGRERLWGAVSWGLAYLLLGGLVDVWRLEVMFILHACSSMCLVVVLLAWGPPTYHAEARGDKRASDHDSAPPDDSLAEWEVGDLEAQQVVASARGTTADCLGWACGAVWDFATRFGGVLCASRLTSLFFLVAFVSGAGMSLVESFLFLYLTESFSASNFLCGVAVAVTVVFEIPIFHWSPWLLERMGPLAMIITAQVAYAVRVTAYTLVTNPWQVLALEPLHGVTFGLFHAAGVVFVASIAPPAQLASYQGVLQMVAMGLGPTFSMLVGGALMDELGEAVVFRGYALATLVVASTVAVCSRGAWARAVSSSEVAVEESKQPEPGAEDPDSALSRPNGEPVEEDNPADPEERSERRKGRSHVMVVHGRVRHERGSNTLL